MNKPVQRKNFKTSQGSGTERDSAQTIVPDAKQDQSKDDRGPGPRLIVGIGASAGGLDAFKSFFANMSPDSGMAFVLVQHLSPDHKSMLADLVGRITAMTVAEAHDGVSIEKNCIYVIPPDATLTIEDRVLRVVKPAPPREHRRPIDTFFSSLGEDQGENAVCIVLSGTGSDGARGLARIKEFGGLTLAQAEFDHHAMDGMPHSAAATGFVDDVLPVEKMPARLMDYQRHLANVAGRKADDGTRGDATEHLKTISTLLRAKIGHDFSQYKEKTVVRRIQRRMQVLQIDTVPAYIARLREDTAEMELLFRELLIGVTQFFRDAEAFDALRIRISSLLEKREADDPVRIWVPACATGEEVYSIAILLKEEMERRGVRFQVQIFGTDIDAGAVAAARSGRFSSALAGVSPDRVERWFAEDGEDRCPIKAIREMCVFSTHSVIKDPPFSKLDLVSCRNLMIYFDPDLQDRVLRTFHYALRPGATLFLGSSETVSRSPNLFTAVDKKRRIFQRRDAETMLPQLGRPLPRTRPPAPLALSTSTVDDRIDRSARRALEKYSPVYVVIDKRHDVMRFSGSEIGHYLGPSPGTASLNLFDILRKPLRPVVRSALQTMSATKQPVVQSDVAFEIEGKPRTLTVIVTPLPEAKIDDGLCVVAFQDTGALDRPTDADRGEKSTEGHARALEQELLATKTQLQAAIDEYEIVNEEMKSANEEYQSVNEELQSSNEELETSKEEMQSINEELQTINSEMASKNGLLVSLNSDLRNLFDSTDIATIFLDNDLRVKSFTPGMTDIFHLRGADRGRPITDIVTTLNYAELQRDVRTVLRKLSLIEREVQIGESGSTFIMRIRPYRTVDNVIEGVVITFFDISERKKSESVLQEYSAALRTNEARLSAIINQATAGIAEVDLEGRYVFVNDRYCEIVGRPAEELRTLRMQDITYRDDLPKHLQGFNGLIADGRSFEIEKRYVRPDGALVWIHNSVSGLRDADGVQRHALAITLEISARKQSEQTAALLMGELDHRVKNILAIISAIIMQTLRSSPSPGAFAASMEGRIVAISKAHSLLTERGGRSEASLSDFIATELAPYARGENVTIAGVDVALTPKAGLSMAMALHELASNAAKYGALSTPAGKLSVTWEVGGTAPNQAFKLTWWETGGPVLQPPTRRGFGTTLIERSLKHEFDAIVDRQFLPSGLRCVIEIPLAADVGRVRGTETNPEDVQ